ncbi:hypothetical protein [Avrilella dinanensis]|uniref:hypothetical protein n=1 Tax=Avrilella dinanensis TaxID=2008672 RepID=UPI002409709E|nr:hypothetical protein [Avrilella dinanensis]
MLKQTFITVFLIAGFLSLVSCDSDDNTTVNPYAQFQGNWSGTFSGDDEGIWRVTIDENGVATGVLESNTAFAPFDLEGQVSANGEVSAEYYDAGGQLAGQLSGIMTATTVSGNWSSGWGPMGTWSGNKE